MRLDFPALGKPTSPTSATTLSSRTTVRSSPGSPRSAKPGAFRLAEASAALPRPPFPPAATTISVPGPMRSPRTAPRSSVTTVPSGTCSTRSSPCAPLRLAPAPCPPFEARRCGLWWKSTRVVTSGSTRRITLPPGPPLPPSGPPSGLNFSRCTEATPLPPRPAVTFNVTRSTNVGTAIGLLLLCALSVGCFRFSDWCPADVRLVSGSPVVGLDRRRETAKGRPAFPAGRPFAAYETSWRPRSLGGRNDVHDTATALGTELDVPADQREQGVVAAPADAAAGVEVGAALTHDDLAGVHQLATVALYTETLGVGVPTVLGRGCALLVCHEFSPSSCRVRVLGSGVDLGHLDLGVLLTVTLALAVPSLVLVLENRDLRALGGAEHLRRHTGLAKRGGSRGDVLAVDEHEYEERDGVGDLVGNLVDLDDVTDSYLLVLAATAHDRVHRGLTLFVGLQVRFCVPGARSPHGRVGVAHGHTTAHRRRGSSLRTACPRVKTSRRRATYRLRDPFFLTGTCGLDSWSGGGSTLGSEPLSPWASWGSVESLGCGDPSALAADGSATANDPEGGPAGRRATRRRVDVTTRGAGVAGAVSGSAGGGVGAGVGAGVCDASAAMPSVGDSSGCSGGGCSVGGCSVGGCSVGGWSAGGCSTADCSTGRCSTGGCSTGSVSGAAGCCCSPGSSATRCSAVWSARLSRVRNSGSAEGWSTGRASGLAIAARSLGDGALPFVRLSVV